MRKEQEQEDDQVRQWHRYQPLRCGIEDQPVVLADQRRLRQRILENRPARLCAQVGMIWSWEMRRCDHESQYPFASHVPVIRKLEGGQALLHKMVVHKLLLIGKSRAVSN